MKTLTLATALALVLHASACAATQQPAATPSPAPTTEHVVLGPDGASPENIAFLKSLLYSDRPLEQVVGDAKPDSPTEKEEPWRSFAQALAHTKQGRAAEAKKDLRRVLAMPNAETRVLLSAWTALRALGERPPPGEADKVQGVVLEVHNEAGIGTLAAYADGRARWLGGLGAVTFWEAPGDEQIDALIREFLKAAEPLVKRTPAAERHTAAEVKLEHFRVSVLTFGGIHTVDVYGPEVDRGHFTRPVFIASVELVTALQAKKEEKNK